MAFADFFRNLLNAEHLIQTGGLLLMMVLVFTENGIFFGFFIPGDTLLFTAGLLTATGKLNVPIWLLILSLFVAAAAGSLFGYYFGMKVGEGFKNRPDTLFFKKKYVTSASDFFTKYGRLALIGGRFIAGIRTFVPILAGISNYPFASFLLFNIIGAALWVSSLLLLGYFLGIKFPEAGNYLEYIILGIVAISWIPVLVSFLLNRRKRKVE